MLQQCTDITQAQYVLLLDSTSKTLFINLRNNAWENFKQEQQIIENNIEPTEEEPTEEEPTEEEPIEEEPIEPTSLQEIIYSPDANIPLQSLYKEYTIAGFGDNEEDLKNLFGLFILKNF